MRSCSYVVRCSFQYKNSCIRCACMTRFAGDVIAAAALANSRKCSRLFRNDRNRVDRLRVHVGFQFRRWFRLLMSTRNDAMMTDVHWCACMWAARVVSVDVLCKLQLRRRVFVEAVSCMFFVASSCFVSGFVLARIWCKATFRVLRFTATSWKPVMRDLFAP